MKHKTSVKTTDQVRKDFDRVGASFRAWAIERGYKPNLVYEVLRGRILCKRGKSHEIAVLLGLKDGEIEQRKVA